MTHEDEAFTEALWRVLAVLLLERQPKETFTLRRGELARVSRVSLTVVFDEDGEDIVARIVRETLDEGV